MDVLTHFRSIEELTKTLSREQRLLSEMFEKRKLMKFPLWLAIDLVGGNEQRLGKWVDYGVSPDEIRTLEIFNMALSQNVCFPRNISRY